MFKNQYDTDATTFSPNGRLFQVEYACEAVKQGSTSVGLVSKEFAVVAGIKRQISKLAGHQPKVLKIDDHLGMVFSGLVADSRVLTKYMQNECLNHKYVYEAPMHVGRLVGQIADKAQAYTQKSDKRPYGVGLLVAGYDRTGPHLFQALPDGNMFEYHAQAMGARSQSAKTYLEKHVESFADMPIDDLIRAALNALKGSASDGLTSANAVVGFVGKNTSFTILENDAIREYVSAVNDEEEKRPDASVSASSSSSSSSASASSSVSASSSSSSDTPAGASGNVSIMDETEQ